MVVIHVGNQELMEAAHSVVSVTEAGENIRDSAAIGLSVAGSLATVIRSQFKYLSMKLHHFTDKNNVLSKWLRLFGICRR